MANYKIKDLQQASSLNGAIAFEIQDGNNKSTFATLDQIAEFLGNDTPVVLRVKRSGEGGYLPDMTIAEITAAYAKIVADPVHNIPVVSIPDAGGLYLLPSGYNTNVGLNSILGHYYSLNYVQPYVLELTNSTFTFGRNGGNKDVKIGELAVSSGVSIAYMDIADGDTSENISDIVGGPVSFHETCNALKLSTIAAGFRFSSGVKTVYIPIATDVSISGDVYTLSLEYEKEAVVTRLQVREQNGVFSASRTDYSIPDLETDFTEQLSRLEIALRANGSDLVYSSPRVVIEASESRSNYVEVPIGAVAVDDKLSLSLGLIKITSGAPSGFSFALVDAAGTSIANVLMLQGQLTGTFTVRTTASDARLRLFAGKDGSTAGVGVEYGTVMLVRGDIPASALSLLDLISRYDSKYADIVVPCQQATDAANAAKTAANTAAANATTAAGNATTAANDANNGATAANNAATLANNKATDANNAATAANNGATAANQAAEAAEVVVTTYDDVINALAHSDCSLEQRITTLESLLAAVFSGGVVVPALKVTDLLAQNTDIVRVGVGAPSIIPDRAGQFYINTTAKTLYYSTGNTAISDWNLA